ncbi:MAG: D-alanine--D-alanine ligase [Eudoraea sp.]|nr:D-alanine--D-alanine ligase [Eudoraea sp.]
MKMNIAIIMGGYSSEYKISLKSGNVVYQYLDKEKFNGYRIHILKDKWVHVDDNDEEFPINRHDFTVGLPNEKVSFDCVFNAIHGSPGEDGYMQAYFKLLEIPQTSCGHYQAALTFNKRDLLSVLKPYGILSAESYYLNQGDIINEDKIIEKVGLPCFVKANRAGSSFGISKVYEKSALKAAIDNAYNEDDEVLIESFLDGVEVSVGVIKYQGKTKVLPITEIISDNDFFDYEAKYEGKSREITPARISKTQEENVRKMARKAYDILKMRGFSRSEFIFIGNTPYMLEMNTTPGLTEESILPEQARAAGITLSELFQNAIEEALSENK